MLIAITFWTVLIARILAAYKSPVDFDTYGHLYFSSEVRKQRAGAFGSIIPQVVEGGRFYHPFLWHWLISFINLETCLKHGFVISAIFEAVFCSVLVYYFSYLGFDATSSIIGIGLYLFSPNTFSQLSIGPRVASLTPRLLSEHLGMLYLLIQFSTNFSVLSLGFFSLCILGGVTLLISKFAVQVLFFLLPVSALISLSFDPLGALIGSIIVALIISRGKFWFHLHRQYNHLVSYFLANLRGETGVSDRNSIFDFFNSKTLTINNLAYYLLVRNSLSGLVLKAPLVLLFAFFCYSSIEQSAILTFPKGILPIILAAFVIFFITSLRPFLFLGEAERYVNYVLPCIIVGILQNTQTVFGFELTLFVICYGIIFWIIEIVIVNPWKKRSVNEQTDKIFDYLNSISANSKLAIIPYHSVGVYRLMLQTSHYVFYPHLMKTGSIDYFVSRYEKKYPFLDLDKLDTLAEKVDLNFVLIDPRQVDDLGVLKSNKWAKLEVPFDSVSIFQRIEN